MNTSFFIARRYFFSGKKKNFINIISIISMLVVGIATMSLIIVLSVFNGLEGLLRSLYNDFDPEMIITPQAGKSFEYNDELKAQLSQVPGIKYVTEVIEDNVLIRYNNAERVVRMKGVSDEFLVDGRINNSIVYGSAKLREGDVNYAIVGMGIQYDLSIKPSNDFFTIQVYYPRNINPGITDPTSIYSVRHIMPSGTFSIEKYYDENYMFVPVNFASQLLRYGDKRTGLELSLQAGTNPYEVKKGLIAIFGDRFQIRLGEEIHEDLFKILSIEKLFVYIIFSLIIGIASINIYFVLTMLALEKKKDIAALAAQGAEPRLIRNVFINQGMMIAFSGAFLGLILGLAISFTQQYFGIISMGMQTAIMDAYPVKVAWTDVLISCGCIITITIIASIAPARFAVKTISMREL
ncbi:MAG: ABC transporter permease [Cyclobacteriaceae bacterium]